ncbi:MAG: phosphoribosylanthranilate isomerase [Candidatus Omnitrophica bacterium]|nr:phosphoribosylanthranilate isomerase [Candidatus Omnitrophota bacterium]
MARIKICGITNVEDAIKAAFYGAYAVGFIFYKKSPRYISPSKAEKIISALPPFVTPVGIFVNHNERALNDICRFTGIKTIQLHGDEKPDYFRRLTNYKTIKAFRVDKFFNVKKAFEYKVDAYLFDAYSENEYGGTGEVFNWELIKGVTFPKPFILSGGIGPENIKSAIEEVKPFAVDVSSSVERLPGIKDHKILKSLFDAVSGL